MRGRRRLRIAVAVLLAVVVFAGVGVVVGVAWYFSGFALAVAGAQPPQVQVRAGPGAGEGSQGSATIVLPDSDQTRVAGLTGVTWADGWGVMGGEVSDPSGRAATPDAGGDLVRTWQDRRGTLPDRRVPASLDADVFLGDPSVVGLAHEDVDVTSDVGILPTWLVPAADPARSTWIVFVHGRGGSREESLRYLPLWHDLGYPVLVPSYRNDQGAPAAPDNRYGLGETEWRDVDAAVGEALTRGARHVVLAGWSMGGAIALQELDRGEHPGALTGVVLDAPVVDWRDTLLHQGSLVGLPDWWSRLAIRLVELRGGMDFDRFDWVSRADELPDVPILLIHSDSDGYVPNGPSLALADARPDLVTLVRTGPADHTREWNVDPQGYESTMRAWFEAGSP